MMVRRNFTTIGPAYALVGRAFWCGGLTAGWLQAHNQNGDEWRPFNVAITEPTSTPKDGISSMVIHKKWLQEKFAEMDARTGIVIDPTATAEKVRAMMLADGVRCNDNEVSREMIRLREESG